MTLPCEIDRSPTLPAGAPPLVLLHGFGQTARCWGAVGTDLALDHPVTRPDAPGHGDAARVQADLVTTAGLLAATGGRAIYVGYSMGARMALHVAVHHPEMVERLVLVGGTAGIEDRDDRAARQDQDRQNAARLRVEGVEAFFATWFDQPLFAGLPAEARFLDERRRNTAEGLASSLEQAGTGSQYPLWDRLSELEMPVLVMAGARDERYAALAARMADTIGGNAEVALVPEAGHTAHLERPEAFLAVLRPWLDRHLGRVL